MTLTAADAAALDRCLAGGGIALFPADTVYGLACDPGRAESVERLYALKGRRPDKPAAVLFFSLEAALDSVPELGDRLGGALAALLPGALTLLLANPERRFPLACGPDPRTLGLRVPALGTALAALAVVRRPLLQSSANRSGAADARTVAEVPAALREAVDLVLDAGPLPGTPSTVVDLRGWERDGTWSVVRHGAVPEAEVARALEAA